ncbi:alpha/beta fold hydrolase [Compostimonas suwonensis]|uniref:Pimeloyl-ACP methyl ester carboxylesterase n=1 Tax=Compostimonas suwonensis TaxID=1048394 RepID=A0A2M9BCK6_9MICO|nr:alpha/beta hydrolase [Compostimonas suwonensis]PJJ55686.1 pimeloyl-ACP methyl ester carboxylesterase [Compostimonas suwonensis]
MPAPVILVHGLRTSATMWRSQLAALDARGIPATAVDLPGHGSRLGERFTLESALATIGDAVSSAQTFSGLRPYLVGFSLGGYLAIEWAAANPGRVSGLLIAGSGTRPHPVVLGGWRVLARGIHLFPDRGRALNDFTVRLFVPEPGASDVLDGGVALEVMDDVLRALPTLAPVERLSGIEAPVLFVNGRFDHIRLQARRFLAATPRGRLVTVAGASHMVSVVRPEEFTRLLLDGYEQATGGTSLQ